MFFIKRPRSAWLVLLAALALVAAACGDDDGAEPVADSVTTSVVDDTSREAGHDESEGEEAGHEDHDEDGEGHHDHDSTIEIVEIGGVDAEANHVIEVSIHDGQVTVAEDTEVSLGDVVRIVVSADTTEEVHIHGYDLLLDVAPGEAGETTFTATVPGIFEVELESQGLLLFELVVR